MGDPGGLNGAHLFQLAEPLDCADLCACQRACRQLIRPRGDAIAMNCAGAAGYHAASEFCQTVTSATLRALTVQTQFGLARSQRAVARRPLGDDVWPRAACPGFQTGDRLCRRNDLGQRNLRVHLQRVRVGFQTLQIDANRGTNRACAR